VSPLTGVPTNVTDLNALNTLSINATNTSVLVSETVMHLTAAALLCALCFIHLQPYLNQSGLQVQGPGNNGTATVILPDLKAGKVGRGTQYRWRE
jgi:hypothetical protein